MPEPGTTYLLQLWQMSVSDENQVVEEIGRTAGVKLVTDLSTVEWADSSWTKTTDRLPAEGVAVLTILADAHGVRNEAKLIRSGRMWFLEGGAMYTYYTPTHWKDLDG